MGASCLSEIRLVIYPFFEDASWKFFQVEFGTWNVKLWGGKEKDIVVDKFVSGGVSYVATE